MHLEQSTVKIKCGSKNIYIDPFNIKDEPHDADHIFVTHPHHDHLSVRDMIKIKKKDTTLIIPFSCAKQAEDSGIKKVIEVEPNKEYIIDEFLFKTVPAYNLDKTFHVKESNWVGYIISANDKTYYHSGDTDFIPEMKTLRVNIAFIPIGGTYTMNAEEAAEAVNTFKPQIAVPIHYGGIVGKKSDADNFVKLIKNQITGLII